MTPTARYRLVAVDGEPLPIALPYGTQRCVVAAGTLVLEPPDALVVPVSDGRITWTLAGVIGDTIVSAAYPEEIFWLGEAVDRLDATHLTFPGGYRKWARAPEFFGAHHGARTWKRGPEFVATRDSDRLDVAPLPGPVRAHTVARIFGVHRWSFAMDDDGAGARAPAG